MSATTGQAGATNSPGAAFTTVMSTALDYATTKLSQKADQLTGRLGESGGAKQQAGARGARAALRGQNPVWAAIKGAWSGGGAAVKAAIVAAVVSLVLMLLLSPVLLLVFLLALLVAAAVAKLRSQPA